MRLRALIFTLISLASSIVFAQSPYPDKTKTIVFENVNVIPMDRDRIQFGQDVVIRDGTVESIEKHRNRRWGRGTVVVDGHGKYLIPGLCDMHIHTQFGDSEELKLYLINGVTTVLNLSGTPKLLQWRMEIEEGKLAGPNFHTAGPIIDGDRPTNRTHDVVRNRAEAIKEVDAQAKAGYEFLKPYSALSGDAYYGVRDEARHVHMRMVGHVPWAIGVKNTVEAGQQAIAHVEELYRFFVDRHDKKVPPDAKPDPRRIPELAKLLHDHKTWVITTLSADTNFLKQATNLKGLLAEPNMKYVPAWYRNECKTGDPYANRGADWLRQNEIMVPFLFRIVGGLKHGHVRTMSGTDATNPIQIPGFSLHDELEALVQAGLTPWEALQTSTANPAEFLRRNDAGTITKGKRAELVLLNANPLKDIRNAREIAGVMTLHGWIDAAQLEAMRQEIVERYAEETEDPGSRSEQTNPQ